MKQVVAVAPYIRKGIINFKLEAYNAWKESGGKVATPYYPKIKPLVGWFHNHELPSFGVKNAKEARLRFIEPINRYFDAFPDYVFYEVIPFIWDCWPCLDERLSSWLYKHKVRTAIFTSEQAAKRIQTRFPNMHILVITEGINTSLNIPGKKLKDRNIDLLEFGRPSDALFGEGCFDNINRFCTKEQKIRMTDEELVNVLADSKITIALPKCDTDANIGAGQETLTQRYWENMLSRTLMVGHAPKELVDLIGYNPCIELEGFKSHRGMSKYCIEQIDSNRVNNQLQSIISNIEGYQELVDKNRVVALRMGDWKERMKHVQEWLNSLGYSALCRVNN